MSNAKIISMVDAAACEARQNSLEDLKDALAMVDDEINQLHDIIKQLTLRVELLEAGMSPEVSA